MIDKDQKIGMFIGLAIGDALGAPLEFQPPRKTDNLLTKFETGGHHNVSLGEWTDDTSMAYAMATSLIEKKEFDADDIMHKFCQWFKDGKFSTRNKCFDIGNTISSSLNFYLKGIREGKSNPYCGITDHNTAGNGALMRLAPVVIFANNSQEAIQFAIQQTLLTHGHQMCVQYSSMLAEELYSGRANEKFLRYKIPVDTPEDNVNSSGFVKHTYEAAWWAFQSTENFEDCIIKAVNRGDDADTVGAVAGMIAGRHYGHNKIPSYFKDNLMMYSNLLEVAEKICKNINS